MSGRKQAGFWPFPLPSSREMPSLAFAPGSSRLMSIASLAPMASRHSEMAVCPVDLLDLFG